MIKIIRSSRRLEKECIRNKELIWLTNALTPDFKTIADFRKDNNKAFKNIFKEFQKLCHKLELISFKTIAIDGTKMRGQNSLNEVYKKESIEKVENEIQEQIDNYLKELDEMDKREQAGSFSINQNNVEEITKKLEQQMKRKDKIEHIKNIFSNNPEVKIYFATDNDCCLQSDKGKVRPGYNPQTAVEDKNKLIIVADVINEQNDKKQLTPDAENKKSKNEKNKYTQEDFSYDREKDIYICPEGKELKKSPKKAFLDKNKREVFSYKCKSKTYNDCSEKEKCAKGINGRKLLVLANREKTQKYIDSLKDSSNKKIIMKRKELAEHPFGTIKRCFGYTYFLLKGIEKVKAEFSFISFIYNLKRVLNIVPLNKLIEVISG